MILGVNKPSLLFVLVTVVEVLGKTDNNPKKNKSRKMGFKKILLIILPSVDISCLVVVIIPPFAFMKHCAQIIFITLLSTR